jgi:hypothetical protein
MAHRSSARTTLIGAALVACACLCAAVAVVFLPPHFCQIAFVAVVFPTLVGAAAWSVPLSVDSASRAGERLVANGALIVAATTLVMLALLTPEHLAGVAVLAGFAATTPVLLVSCLVQK